MIRLAHIHVFPFKSFGRLDVDHAQLLPSGALEHDRQFAVFDSAGRPINGKRNPRIHRLRLTYDTRSKIATVGQGECDDLRRYDVDRDRAGIEDWLSRFFEQQVNIRENSETGFPDDLDSPGPTLVSTATLEVVASWFTTLSVEDVRRRFRANLEIDGVEAFWEDRLFSTSDHVVRFRIGDVPFHGVSPCSRCVVPTRCPETGEQDEHFAQTFMSKRTESLPDWAERSRFDHFYRLCVNTRLARTTEPRQLRTGDVVSVVRTEEL